MTLFTPGLPAAHALPAPAHWFLFEANRLLVLVRDGVIQVPEWDDPSRFGLRVTETHYLGCLGGRACKAGVLATEADLPGGTRLEELRRLAGRLPAALYTAAGYGLQLTRWGASRRFCSRCGRPLEDRREERARECPVCAWVEYPVMPPAVIVAVTRGERLLLARARRFPGRLFSVLAGYVEAGESLEACVRREVREEVGLTIRRLRYVGSQPWPFSGALMAGFTAEYAAGRLCVDGEEIVEADWFAAGRLPAIPEPPSLARRLIDAFVRRQARRPPEAAGQPPAVSAPMAPER
jgi:NAD+ diphosphatase